MKKLLLMLLLTGCSTFHPIDDVEKQLIGKILVVNKSSFIYMSQCVEDLPYYFIEDECATIQSFGNYRMEQGVTKANFTSYSEYIESKDYWDKVVFNRVLFDDEKEIVKPIPKGTLLEIVKLHKITQINAEPFIWLIHVKVKGSSKIFNLPGHYKSLNGELGPSWLNRGENVDNINQPRFKEEFISIVDE